MAEFRLEVRLEVPPALAFDALEETLRAIASREGPWEGFALHVALADSGLPDVGYIAIPIDLDVASREAGLNQLHVTFHASRHPESFPGFSGTVGFDFTGPTGATLWVAGKYDVPLRSFGRIVDATLLRGIAGHALTNFLDDVAVAVRARIDKREAEYVRYRMFAR